MQTSNPVKTGLLVASFPCPSACQPLPACSDQLARCKDRLRVDIGHLSHPVYGAPELATALVDNPAEYLPIVSLR